MMDENLQDPGVQQTRKEGRLDASNSDGAIDGSAMAPSLQRYSENSSAGIQRNLKQRVCKAGYVTKPIRRKVNDVVNLIVDRVSNLTPKQRRTFAGRLLQDERLGFLFEPVIGRPQEAIMKRELVENLKDGLQEVKAANSNDKLAAKHSVLSMVVGKEGELYKTTLAAKMLNIHPRNMKLAAERRKIISLGATKLWALKGRNPRTNAINQAIKDTVAQFWLDNTKVSPKVRDVMKKRTQPIQYIDITQAELWQNFVDQHPEVKIGIRQFEYLKPSCIRKLKERNTCCCVKHEQADLYKRAFNMMRSRLHENCTCNCVVCASEANNGICQAKDRTFDNVSTFWRAMVCDRAAGDEWHQLKCINSDCGNCGRQLIDLCPRENKEQVVDWQVYGYVNEPSKKGTSRRLKLLDRNGSSKCMLDNMFEHMSKFVYHNFVAHWQSKQFKESMRSLRDDTVLSVVDFSENYTLKPFNEIQAQHWYNEQISILVHITMFKVKGKIKKSVHFFISDDRIHDTHFVQKAFKLHLKWLQENDAGHMKYHLVWSDGCAAQFKSRRAFYHVTRYHHQHKMRMQWNFFGSGHGKGTHDGEGAIVKLWLEAEQRKKDGKVVKNAETACELLREKDSEVKRVFWEVTDIDRSQSYDVLPVKGVQSLHCVSSIDPNDPTKLMCRSLSCFCKACINFDWPACENTDHCGRWELRKLEPTQTDHLQDDGNEVEDLWANDVDNVDETVQVGDYFGVFTAPDNYEEVPYYIIQCTEVKHTLEADTTDDYGNMWYCGDEVLAGNYFELIPGCHQKYKLLKGKKVFVCPESVIGVRFPLEPVKHKIKGTAYAYELSNYWHEMLLGNLPEIVDSM